MAIVPEYNTHTNSSEKSLKYHENTLNYMSLENNEGWYFISLTISYLWGLFFQYCDIIAFLIWKVVWIYMERGTIFS